MALRFLDGAEPAGGDIDEFNKDTGIVEYFKYNEIGLKINEIRFRSRFHYLYAQIAWARLTFRYRPNFVIAEFVITRVYYNSRLLWP